MTVASLWKALDQAGCGQPVGEEDLIDPQRRKTRVNPWTFNDGQRRQQRMEDRLCLAVDLSIWVCESLTSTSMNDHNENPALHLVFTRTMKLLSMGIRLIYVIEGKRRIRCSPGENQDKFRRRRSGTSFWKACKQCEELLEMLGVPIVRAKAEGEALCALLNQKGIVDGVISNDGDCLLFGAKVVYTKFSMENLEKGCVMRYDASQLYAIADYTNNNDEEDDRDAAMASNIQESTDNSGLVLSREDLIAFALLTGSDLAGNGLAKVGHKKAIRFIKKCRDDYPLTAETAAIEVLRSWARSVPAVAIKGTTYSGEDAQGSDLMDEDEVNGTDGIKTVKKKQACCSRCLHAGSKRSHQKHGCEICGTAPGEPCYKLSSDDKFRKLLREKALAMTDPIFDPTLVVDAYMRPNDNQLPASLLQKGITSSKALQMGYPKLREIVSWPVTIKGHCLKTSQDYAKQSVMRLLARRELFQDAGSNLNECNDQTTCRQHARLALPRERPMPTHIVRKFVQNRIDVYEVCWTMNATVTDEDGQGKDGYEFSTVEPQDLVKRLHPRLIDEFNDAPKEFKKQGDAEMQKRREFLETFFQPEQEQTDRPISQKRRAKEERKFDLPERREDHQEHLESKQQRAHKKGYGDDVEQILRFAKPQTKSRETEVVEDYDFSSIESGSLSSKVEHGLQNKRQHYTSLSVITTPKEVRDKKKSARENSKDRGSGAMPTIREEEAPPRPPARQESISPVSREKKKDRDKKKKKRKKKRSRERRVTFDVPGPEPQKRQLELPEVIGTEDGSFHRPLDGHDDISCVTGYVCNGHPAGHDRYSQEDSQAQRTRECSTETIQMYGRVCQGQNEEKPTNERTHHYQGKFGMLGVSPEYKRNRLNGDLREEYHRHRPNQFTTLDHGTQIPPGKVELYPDKKNNEIRKGGTLRDVKASGQLYQTENQRHCECTESPAHENSWPRHQNRIESLQARKSPTRRDHSDLSRKARTMKTASPNIRLKKTTEEGRRRPRMDDGDGLCNDFHEPNLMGVVASTKDFFIDGQGHCWKRIEHQAVLHPDELRTRPDPFHENRSDRPQCDIPANDAEDQTIPTTDDFPLEGLDDSRYPILDLDNQNERISDGDAAVGVKNRRKHVDSVRAHLTERFEDLSIMIDEPPLEVEEHEYDVVDDNFRVRSPGLYRRERCGPPFHGKRGSALPVDSRQLAEREQILPHESYRGSSRATRTKPICLEEPHDRERLDFQTPLFFPSPQPEDFSFSQSAGSSSRDSMYEPQLHAYPHGLGSERETQTSLFHRGNLDDLEPPGMPGSVIDMFPQCTLPKLGAFKDNRFKTEVFEPTQTQGEHNRGNQVFREAQDFSISERYNEMSHPHSNDRHAHPENYRRHIKKQAGTRNLFHDEEYLSDEGRFVEISLFERRLDGIRDTRSHQRDVQQHSRDDEMQKATCTRASRWEGRREGQLNSAREMRRHPGGDILHPLKPIDGGHSSSTRERCFHRNDHSTGARRALDERSRSMQERDVMSRETGIQLSPIQVRPKPPN